MRRANPEDIPAMQDVFRAAGAAAWAHIFPPETIDKLNPPVRWAEAVIAQARSGTTQVLIAESAGKVVGFAVVRPSSEPDANDQTAELDSFYTHPSVWGQGAGRGLMAAVVELLRQQGFRRVTAWTAEKNHRPRRIYEAAGWQLDGKTRSRTLHGIGFVELRYKLTLP